MVAPVLEPTGGVADGPHVDPAELDRRLREIARALASSRHRTAVDRLEE